MAEPDGKGVVEPVRLLVDEPNSLGRDDAFGHESYAETLIEALEHSRQPMTIGLLGPWGVGKSSVLTYLDAELRSDSCAVVRFDAWRYDAAAFRRHFLREVARSLNDQRALDTRVFDLRRRLEPLYVDRQVTTFRALPTVDSVRSSAIQALVVGIALWVALQIPAVRASFSEADPAKGALLSVVAAALTFVGTLVRELMRPVPTTETQRRIEDPERFYDLFRDVVAATKSRRLVIAIDNLDRCTAEDALALLATIKTYLEPAAKDAEARRGDREQTDVMFVIAVDDGALRRHLQQAAGPGVGDADEYLRKIFSASVRFAPLLRDDLRLYVGQKIDQVAGSLALDEESNRGLAGLVAAAYRDSPRQIIQFLNNLQLKLSLVREREGGEQPLIRGDISRLPLMIAKLALIEDRWPHHYALLLRQPHQLELLHERAREPSETEPPDGKAEATALRAEWEGLAPFLRLAEDIRVQDLRPYLLLKQSEEEVTLPGYERFRASLVQSEWHAVDALLDDQPELLDSYKGAAHRLFERELVDGNVRDARAVLDAVLVLSRLHDDVSARQLVGRAVGDPAFAGQLAYVAARPLLLAGLTLPDASRREKVVNDVIARLADPAPHRTKAAAEALAAGREQLTPTERQAIARQLAGDLPPNDFEPLAILAANEVVTLPPSVMRTIVARLEERPDLLVDPIGHGAARALTLVIVRRGPVASSQALLGAFARASGSLAREGGEEIFLFLLDLFTGRGDGPVISSDARAALRRALPLMREKTATAFGRLLWDWAIVTDDGDELAELTEAALRLDDALASDTVASQLRDSADRLSDSARASVIARLLRTGGPLAPDLVERIAELLIAVAADEDQRVEVIGELADQLSAVEPLDEDSSARESLAELALVRATGGTGIAWLALAAKLGFTERVRLQATSVTRQALQAAGSEPPPIAQVEAAVRLADTLGPQFDLSSEIEHLLNDRFPRVWIGALVDRLIPVQSLLDSSTRTWLRRQCVPNLALAEPAGSTWIARMRQLDFYVDSEERDRFAREVAKAARALSIDDGVAMLERVRVALGLPEMLSSIKRHLRQTDATELLDKLTYQRADWR